MARALLGHLVIGLATLVVAACGHQHDDGGHHGHEHSHEHESSAATGAACPDSSTLAYDSFGEAFLASYCTSCHASSLTGDARVGAPPGFDFDSLDGVRAHAADIDAHAGIGPLADNRAMPLADPEPSDDERRALAEWLACGAP
jgi:uncharacterized membrane protein